MTEWLKSMSLEKKPNITDMGSHLMLVQALDSVSVKTIHTVNDNGQKIVFCLA